ncbi:MAG: DegT/DnrJ/EryC1/StrS family aminotransferase [Candidatus Omnitrophota bacterium]
MRVPSAGTPISWTDIQIGFGSFFLKKSYIAQFEQEICNIFGTKYCFAFSSGTAAFYIVLKALRRLSEKEEVILPAYTAPHLVLPIWQAGLKPILCDISGSTFNLDIDKLYEVITDKTLCIVPVHMFGIPCQMDKITEIGRKKGIFVFEDSASALGAMLSGKKVGSIGDVSIFSFNRGKNMSTFSGGCITTDAQDIARAIEQEAGVVRRPNNLDIAFMPIKTIALALAVRPLVYTLCYPLIAKFKDTALHSSFEVKRYTDFQAAVGLSLLKRLNLIVEKRHNIGSRLYEVLKDIDAIILPQLPPGSLPVYNQFPVLFRDSNLRDNILNKLLRVGIEATTLYREPIHHIHNLGYSLVPDPFPNATYLAHRLLLLPAHPLVSLDTLDRIIGIFRTL